MEPISLLVGFLVLPGVWALQPMDVTVGGQVVAIDEHVGTGRLIAPGDKITIQYQVWDALDHELANSMKRGLPYTMVVGDRNSDPFFSVALAGMRAGGTRYAQVKSDLLPGGLGSIVPPKTDLFLWVNVLAAKPHGNAKVESANAERTQGALEVPRTAHRNGSARTQNPL